MRNIVLSILIYLLIMSCASSETPVTEPQYSEYPESETNIVSPEERRDQIQEKLEAQLVEDDDGK